MRQLEHDLTGFGGAWCGWWASFQFDNAVTYFGGYVEAKLSEVDKETGEPRHSLDELLDLPVSNGDALQRIAAVIPDARERRKA